MKNLVQLFGLVILFTGLAHCGKNASRMPIDRRNLGHALDQTSQKGAALEIAIHSKATGTCLNLKSVIDTIRANNSATLSLYTSQIVAGKQTSGTDGLTATGPDSQVAAYRSTSIVDQQFVGNQLSDKGLASLVNVTDQKNCESVTITDGEGKQVLYKVIGSGPNFLSLSGVNGDEADRDYTLNAGALQIIVDNIKALKVCDQTDNFIVREEYNLSWNAPVAINLTYAQNLASRLINPPSDLTEAIAATQKGASTVILPELANDTLSSAIKSGQFKAATCK